MQITPARIQQGKTGFATTGVVGQGSKEGLTKVMTINRLVIQTVSFDR